MGQEITNASLVNNFSNKFSNEEFSPRFKDLKSAGTAFLPSERNARLLTNTNLTKTNLNYNSKDNVLTTLIDSSQFSNPNNLYETHLRNTPSEVVTHVSVMVTVGFGRTWLCVSM